MFRFLLTGRKDRSILIMSDASTPRTHLLATAGDAVFTRRLRVGAKWASGECGRECCSRDREYRAQSHSRRGFTAEVTQGDASTRLEWVVDSDFGFFPTMRDETFGYILHPVDLATNQVAAAYGRREPRDVVDLLTIHDHILLLGAVIWASAGKALGFTPEGIINEIRRIAR